MSTISQAKQHTKPNLDKMEGVGLFDANICWFKRTILLHQLGQMALKLPQIESVTCLQMLLEWERRLQQEKTHNEMMVGVKREAPGEALQGYLAWGPYIG